MGRLACDHIKRLINAWFHNLTITINRIKQNFIWRDKLQLLCFLVQTDPRTNGCKTLVEKNDFCCEVEKKLSYKLWRNFSCHLLTIMLFFLKLKFVSHLFLIAVIWCQFHQPYGTKHKCFGSHSMAPVGRKCRKVAERVHYTNSSICKVEF
jgi:hypothetical protein